MVAKTELKICVRCNDEFSYDIWHEPYKSIYLCDPCLKTLETEGNSTYKLFRRLEKQEKNFQITISVLHKEYRDLIEAQRSPEKLAIVAAQEAHKKEHGFVVFGPQWRPEGLEVDNPGDPGPPRIIMGVSFQPVLCKTEVSK